MVRQITASELMEALNSDRPPVLIDVREDYEHEDFNIGGSNIPLGEILRHAQEIPGDETVVVYCKRGIRSAIAIQRLQEKYGFTNLLNLQGGIMEWPV
ncbi:rhodanese-like domain-containing protein [Flavihumibacter solisilvae]|uniref:rhodanese-like domain-containing protein n=1 Tax=Flavihumibacter solisilvae TaxID=1349421 RepID=UPI0009E484E5|nr:rhodanese-like domain-containing protein [Flavihumibacter solisilvae]